MNYEFLNEISDHLLAKEVNAYVEGGATPQWVAVDCLDGETWYFSPEGQWGGSTIAGSSAGVWLDVSESCTDPQVIADAIFSMLFESDLI